MKYLLILTVVAASLGLSGAQGADKQKQANKSCCGGGKCCAEQQACCQKSHK